MKHTKRTRGTVSFYLRSSSKEEKPISLSYSYGRGKRFVYAIGHSVNPKYWNNQTKKVKNVVAVVNSMAIRDLMRDLESEVNGFVADCDSKQIEITNDLLRSHLDVFTRKKVLDKPKVIDKSFTSYIKRFIDRKEKELGKGGVINKYKQVLSQLEDFEKEMSYKLSFDNVDLEFYSEFVEYLFYKPHMRGIGYAVNTIGGFIKRIKTFMSESADEELHTNLKYRKFKVMEEDVVAIYLSKEELKKMYDFDLSDKPKLQLARDIFLVGCEMGQRISDYHNLQEHSVVRINEEEYFKIKQKKTEKEVHCKITPAIKEIVKSRYGNKMPNKITHQKLNEDIKEVGRLVGINEKIKIERKKADGKEVKYVPKFKLIMGHTARRTFCTLKYKEGMPIHDIMQLSGHTTVKEFMKYIRNPQEERIAQITSTDAFKNSSILV